MDTAESLTTEMEGLSTGPTPDDLIRQTEIFVKNQMSGNDASHDFEHVERVLRLARLIVAKENERSHHDPIEDPVIQYDPLIITLAALLHDIGDKKYLPAQESLGQGQHHGRPPESQAGQRGLAFQFLTSISAPLKLAETVQEIVDAVSYSAEMKDPDRVNDVLERHPELGPVQDADRLDAIGAVGIARCFTYQAAKAERDARHASDERMRDVGDETGMSTGSRPSMKRAIRHMDKKLFDLEGLTKTCAGTEIADDKHRRLVRFRKWWEEEIALGEDEDEEESGDE